MRFYTIVGTSETGAHSTLKNIPESDVMFFQQYFESGCSIILDLVML